MRIQCHYGFQSYCDRPKHDMYPVNHSSGFYREVFYNMHDDVIKWKHFPRYWPFVRGIDRSMVNSPLKGQWRGALTFSLICARINGWVNNGEAGDLRRRRAHFDVIGKENYNGHTEYSWHYTSVGLILGLRPANVRQRYFVTTSLIGWVKLFWRSGTSRWNPIFKRAALIWLNITVMSKWARWRLKSPAPRLFVQPFVQTQIKEDIKDPRHCEGNPPVSYASVTRKKFPSDDVIMK